MKKMPNALNAYRKTTVFDFETVPPALLKDHQTKEGIVTVLNFSVLIRNYGVVS